MSFGFESRVDAIANVIHRVVGDRGHERRDIIFFAAAHNDGLNSNEMYPASDPHVISVRGTNYEGAFV